MKSKKYVIYAKKKALLWEKQEKVRDHYHYTKKFREGAHSECNLRYNLPKEISVVFYNGSTYDYHFIIKQLAEKS